MKAVNIPLVFLNDDQGMYCMLEGLQKVQDEYEIAEGVPRAKNFPQDARFVMSKRHKKQIALADCLDNLEAQPVVSERLKKFVESHEAKMVEFLKVVIINHKGKPIPEPYYIMSPLTIVDCIDQERSKIRWNNIDPEFISGVLKLVLKAETIDPDLLLFRPKHLNDRVLINRKFAKEIEDAGFTGMTFMEPAEFMG
jgi:hypothetical protein